MGVKAGLFIVCTAAALGGCASLPPEPVHTYRFTGESTAAEQALPGKPNFRLGIALSGGGLRSALYATGALRALYKRGILEKADIVSTVSGGGYTAYWVYTGQLHHDPDLRRGAFGSARFADDVFTRSLCERLGDANFVPYPTMFAHALVGRSRQLYERRIGETFGREDPGATTFGKLRERVGKGYPHLIVNATVLKPKPQGWRDGLYELTAAGSSWGGRKAGGTIATEETPWSDRYDVPYRLGVAASGAAIAGLLAREVPEPARSDHRKVVLHDGGKSENLGAIALIRRGVPTVVVIDAEYDRTYGFGAYVNLKRRLNMWGGDIYIPGIERFLVTRTGRENPPASYFKGESTLPGRDRKPIRSTIHYVKMSMPDPLVKELEEMWPGDLSKQPLDPAVAAFRTAMDATWEDGGYRCERLASLPVPDERFFKYSVRRYSGWWNRTLRARYTSWGDIALGFPQYSTFDQSMFVDQAQAFISLGYLQALAVPEDAASLER